ncbi:dienelactone hydrolase family protein [Streptomyces longwoodensis]|uniref:dienelactone hydrolase family protein n=1 Tax=Streptomyces longwoodensis TaxID=68231 RepID=UPI003F540630
MAGGVGDQLTDDEHDVAGGPVRQQAGAAGDVRQEVMGQLARYLGDPEEMLARCMPLLADPDRMRGIDHAALDVLRAEPRTDPDRIAAVGYGTGGAIALEVGRDGADLRAIATVNGLITGRLGETARIHCPVWAGVGSEDPIMPPCLRTRERAPPRTDESAPLLMR